MMTIEQRVNEKLRSSKALALMNDFASLAALFPAAHIDYKSPKREAAITKACDPLYPYHYAFVTPKNDYANSVVLIGNEVAVPYMAREVATFMFHLERFYKAIKAANNVQELQAYYKQFTLKPKQLLDALVEDIKYYADRYGFEADIKALVDTCKNHKQSLETV